MEDERKEENIKNAAVAGGAAEVVQRYGSALKEHIAAYSGNDRENQRLLKKSLESISNQKLNPNDMQRNLKQQAGFSAEVMETANYNAEAIIRGDTSRKIRTDDLNRVNDPLFDHVLIDGNGNIVNGSGSQMKFVGSDPKEALEKLASEKYKKYLDNNAKIEVPTDYYADIVNEANKKIDTLRQQLDRQVKDGNQNQAEILKDKIGKYEKIKKNLKKSSVSNKDAMLARKHPKLSTVKSAAGVANSAGLEYAKYSSAIGGSISVIRNLVALVNGEEDEQEAIANVAKDTAVSLANGYATGFGGSTVKGLMQNSKLVSVRALSKTNLPVTVITVAVDAGKTLGSYFNGEIDGVQCLEQLGEQGTGMLASSLFAAIGQVAIPIPVVGGMLGYALASASYGILVSSLKDAKLAAAERAEVERVCEEHVKLIKSYRAELEKTINDYFDDYLPIFAESFDGIKKALEIGDVDGYISSANKITSALGKETLFDTRDDFDKLMNGSAPITI